MKFPIKKAIIYNRANKRARKQYASTENLIYALEKLRAYEHAEKTGYIKRCKKCGSIEIEDGGTFIVLMDDIDAFVEYSCTLCGHGWMIREGKYINI